MLRDHSVWLSHTNVGVLSVYLTTILYIDHQLIFDRKREYTLFHYNGLGYLLRLTCIIGFRGCLRLLVKNRGRYCPQNRNHLNIRASCFSFVRFNAPSF